MNQPSSSALVSAACAAALRASHTPQRRRYPHRMRLIPTILLTAVLTFSAESAVVLDLRKPTTIQSFHPGKKVLVDSASPTGRWGVVFEDDGETGYLYALDLLEQQNRKNPIQEALHIYNAKNVTDKDRKSELAILWSDDGQKACLLINSYPHAVVDFAAKRAYSRTNFPRPSKWKNHDFKWDDQVLQYFRKTE